MGEKGKDRQTRRFAYLSCAPCSPRAVRIPNLFLFLFALAAIVSPDVGGMATERSFNRLDMRRLFNPYVGQWEGEWVISDVDGQVVKKIKLQQQYWWDKGHLKGVMIYQDLGNNSRLTSDIYLENGKIISEVLNDGDSSYYQGHPGENSVLWTPVEHEEILKRRILEYITRNDGTTWFISEGFERFIDDEAIQTLLFRVVMKKAD
jgi:hypothetical protein